MIFFDLHIFTKYDIEFLFNKNRNIFCEFFSGTIPTALNEDLQLIGFAALNNAL